MYILINDNSEKNMFNELEDEIDRIRNLDYKNLFDECKKFWCDFVKSHDKFHILDFSINNVSVTITPDNVLNIYIGFYHPELTTRYGIQVICPINYVSTGRDSGSRFNLYTASGIVPDTPTPPTPTPFSFSTATWAQIAAATPEQLQPAKAA